MMKTSFCLDKIDATDRYNKRSCRYLGVSHSAALIADILCLVSMETLCWLDICLGAEAAEDDDEEREE